MSKLTSRFNQAKAEALQESPKTPKYVRRAKQAPQPEQEQTLPTPEWDEPSEQQEPGLVEFVRDSSIACGNDTILTQSLKELEDIDAKLTTIECLNRMKKALINRKKVLKAFIKQLYGATEQLEESGAIELRPFTEAEKAQLDAMVSRGIEVLPLGDPMKAFDY